jgi:uncharacterized protein (DUF952 family)
MNSDLVFHAVSKRKWKDLNKGGYYSPAENGEDIEITCTTSEKLNDYLNEKFKGRKNLLLLVIDKSRLTSKITFNKEDGSAIIENAINIDAILDKIKLDCDTEGRFDVSVDST